MTESVLEVIMVLRKCDTCGQRKELTHFLVYSGHGVHVKKSLHVCAACRARAYKHHYVSR